VEPASFFAALAAGAMVALLTLYVYSRSMVQRRVVAARIMQGRGDPSFAPEASVLRQRRSRLPFVSMLPLSPEAQERMSAELVRAGWTLKVNEYLGLRLACTAGCALSGLLLIKRFELGNVLTEMLIALAIAFAGWLLPRFMLARARQKRHDKIEEQLPESLLSIAKSLRAGSGMLQALNYAANETPPPLGTELQSTIRDLQLGVEAEDAFADLAARVGSPDLDIAVTAIVIQRTVGGNLSEILTNVTNTIRERANLYREVRVMTTRQRTTANMVAAVPVLIAAFIMLVNPKMFQLLTQTDVGRIALGIGAFFELVGIWLIRKFAKIEV
jgi:tight adherence protein B